MTETPLSGRRIVDLSLPIRNRSNEPPDFAAKITYVDALESARAIAEAHGLELADIPTGAYLSQEFVSLAVHTGTHVDAPYHYGPPASGEPARTIPDVPLEWCCGPAVVLDFSAKGPQEAITTEDVARALDRIDHELGSGEIVLLRTGWDRRFAEADYSIAHPGLDGAACAHLLEQGARVIGIDTNSLDVPVPVCVERLKAGDADAFLACHYLGRRHEYLQLEKLANLDRLPAVGSFVMAFPVLIEGAGAAWARVVALVDAES